MLMTWVNHASFILETGTARLICDPWLEGAAFNNGWRLLSPTKLDYQEFSSVTHIWFSHEHPDHFSPPSLKRIPEEFRRKIVVLFHYTKDKRVVNLCKSLGFQVEELPENAMVEIAQGVKIVSKEQDDLDSWSAIYAEGKTLLNTNDCVIERQAELNEIKQTVGKVDVLLSQFSYANWVGNPGDHAAHKVRADRKKAEIARQIRHFEPEWFVPFASFIYFSHAENSFMNSGGNRIHDVYEFAARELRIRTAVLYPGETWEVGTPREP
jgi:UDP-MurNAc hydroxylase